MIEKPYLPDAKILTCLREAYDLDPVGLDFLPLGNDATAWVYRVPLRDGTARFLKIKQGAVYSPSLDVPYYLARQGVAEVVAPLPTRAGALCQLLDGFNLILYPFIEGQNGMTAGLAEAQWVDFGRVLRRIHDSQLPATLLDTLRQETFQPQWAEMVRKLQARVAQACASQGRFLSPEEQALANFWQSKAAVIAQVVEHCEALGQALSAKQLPLVLCHTDIHTANLLVDAQGGLHIVDWDQPLLAPVERDLTFMLGAVEGQVAADRPEQVAFMRGYGKVTVDAQALAYYQYEWAVQEIGDDGQRVLLTPGLGEATRAAALQHFVQLFAPGDVVEGAMGSGV